MINIRKYYAIEVLLILLLGLIPLLWYKSGYIAFGHDMGFPLAPVDHFLDRLYTWTDRLGPFGSNSVQVLPGIFIHGLEALLFYLGFSLLWVQKLTFMFWFVLPGISMYCFLRYIHPKKHEFSIRLTGSVFYMINHFLLQAWTIAERTKFSIMGEMPLIVLFTLKVFHGRESPVKYALACSITLFFLNGGEGIPLLIVLIIVYITSSIVFTFLSDEKLIPKLKRLFVFYAVTSISWIVLNMYWFYPYIKSYQQTFGQRFDEAWGTAGAVSWSQSISVNSSWLNLFKLRGITDWYTSTAHPYSKAFLENPYLILLNIIFISLALIGIWETKKLHGLLRKSRTLFLIFLLVSIPLSATSHSPLGIFYDYLLVNLPGFTMFRSGYFKFGMILWFAYAYLIASGMGLVTNLVRSKFSSTNKLRVGVVMTSIFVISILIYSYPFLTGSFFDYSLGKTTMIEIPDYVYEAKEELNKNRFSTRTLFLPNSDMRTEYIEYDWKYFSLVELPQSMGRNSGVSYGISAWPNEKGFITRVLREYIQFGYSNLLKFTGVDRAVVQNDFISPDYEGNPLSSISEKFTKSSDFEFDKSIGRWDFYNSSPSTIPRIYSPSKISYVIADPKDLDLIANLPDVLEDGFIVKNLSDEDINDQYYKNIVVAAKCAECQSEVSYNIFFLNSRVMIPGTNIYKIGKIVTKIKKYMTKSPESRINMNLDTSAVLISDLGSLQAKQDAKGVSVAVNDLISNLNEINKDSKEIEDNGSKNELKQKIKFYLTFFISYESQWAAAAVNGPIKLDLVRLENELKNSITSVTDNENGFEVDKDNLSTSFVMETPKKGTYDIYIFSPELVRKTPKLSINNIEFIAIRFDDNWLRVLGVPANDSKIIITIENNKDLISDAKIFGLLNLDDFQLNSPKIEFIALNQSKYLVKTSGSSDYVLGLNSRFDPNWRLSEIDRDAIKYFFGAIKKYQDYNVTEYERRDEHIISDIVFSKINREVNENFNLNSISNGWLIDSISEDTESDFHLYLIEYENQNDFYLASMISIISLVFILTIYYIKYGKNNS